MSDEIKNEVTEGLLSDIGTWEVTDDELAKESGIHPVDILRIRRGIREPRDDELDVLRAAMDRLIEKDNPLDPPRS